MVGFMSVPDWLLRVLVLWFWLQTLIFVGRIPTWFHLYWVAKNWALLGKLGLHSVCDSSLCNSI